MRRLTINAEKQHGSKAALRGLNPKPYTLSLHDLLTKTGATWEFPKIGDPNIAP